MAQQTTARGAAGQAAAAHTDMVGVAGGAGKDARDAAARKVNGMSGVSNVNVTGSGNGMNAGNVATASRSAKPRSVARADQGSRTRGASRAKSSAGTPAPQGSGSDSGSGAGAPTPLVKGAVAPIPVRSSSARTAARIPPVGELKLGWQERASCQQTEAAAFFAPDSERIREREKREAAAKRVCEQCPVRAACLEHALAVPEQFGIWGGMTEIERQEEARRRRGAAAGSRPVVLPIRLGDRRDHRLAGDAGTESEVAA
jgi:WhiB family redox-sensing transcriptional regulator